MTARASLDDANDRGRGGAGGDTPEGPLFSVVIPLHDKVRHVEDAVRSVLAQRCRSFEVIVVDDASSDGSREVVEAMRSPRIRLLTRDVPGPGGYAARNLGTSVARGEWLTYLDADDTWSEDRLERLREAIRAFPDVNLHACAWSVATRDGGSRPNKYSRAHASRGAHLVDLAHYLASLRRNRPVIHTDTVAIRRSSLPDHAVFPADAGLRRGGDGYAWLRLMCRERRLAWSPDVGAQYFVDADNMVTRNVGVDVAALAKPLLVALERELSPRERRWLRAAANGLMWSNWLNEALQGRRSFDLRRHLYWRGAWGQALLLALAAMVPPLVYRGARRLVGLSSLRG